MPISGRPKKFVVDVIVKKDAENKFHKHESVSCNGKFVGTTASL